MFIASRRLNFFYSVVFHDNNRHTLIFETHEKPNLLIERRSHITIVKFHGESDLLFGVRFLGVSPQLARDRNIFGRNISIYSGVNRLLRGATS